MARYQRGDEPAFRGLYARHGAKLFRYLLHRTGSRPVAEELAQQTWLQLHRARMSYQAPARFAPWFHTIALNLLYDCHRSRARNAEDLTEHGAVPETPIGPTPEDGERADRVQRLLAGLPEQYREVILLHRYLEMDFGEIAEALQTTPGAVKQRAHRAYILLRQRATEEGQP